jgi:hypothetical protein
MSDNGAGAFQALIMYQVLSCLFFLICMAHRQKPGFDTPFLVQPVLMPGWQAASLLQPTARQVSSLPEVVRSVLLASHT